MEIVVKYAFQTSILLIVLLLLEFSVSGQATRINRALHAQLDSISSADQQYRKLAGMLTPELSDSLANIFHFPTDSVYEFLMRMQVTLDSVNLLLIDDIIKKHGYPGKSLVGSPTNEVAYYVIQHSPRIKKYLPLLQNTADKKELPFRLVAMMEDRLLVEEEKEQLFGTQLWGNAVKDTATGMVRPEYFFNPIKDLAHINERRRKAGFQTTIEQYAQEMGVPFRIKKPWWWKK